jgi:hypothetical protein
MNKPSTLSALTFAILLAGPLATTAAFAQDLSQPGYEGGPGTGGTGDQSVPGEGSGFSNETPTVGGTTPETDGLTPQQQGVAFAETLTCQTACTASVAGNGDVTVTTTSTTSTGQDVQTEITLADTSVSVTVSTEEATIPVGTVDLPTVEEAQDVVTEITQKVPRSIPMQIALSFNLTTDLTEAEAGDLITDLKKAYAQSLGVDESRFDITLNFEG